MISDRDASFRLLSAEWEKTGVCACDLQSVRRWLPVVGTSTLFTLLAALQNSPSPLGHGIRQLASRIACPDHPSPSVAWRAAITGLVRARGPFSIRLELGLPIRLRSVLRPLLLFWVVSAEEDCPVVLSLGIRPPESQNVPPFEFEPRNIPPRPAS